MTTTHLAASSETPNPTWRPFIAEIVDFKRWALHHLVEETEGFNWDYWEDRTPDHLHPPHEWAAAHVFSAIDRWELHRSESHEPSPQFVMRIGQLGETDRSPAEEAILELHWLIRLGFDYYFADPLESLETELFLDFLRWAEAWISCSDFPQEIESPSERWTQWQVRNLRRKNCTPAFDAWVRSCYDHQVEHWDRILGPAKESQPGRKVDLEGFGDPSGPLPQSIRDIFQLDRQDFVSPFGILPLNMMDEATLFSIYRDQCRSLERELLPLATEVRELAATYWATSDQWSPTAPDVEDQWPDMMAFFDQLGWENLSPSHVGPVQVFALSLAGSLPQLKLLGFPERRFAEIAEIMKGTPPPASIAALLSGVQPTWLPRVLEVQRWLNTAAEISEEGLRRGGAIVDWASAQSFIAGVEEAPEDGGLLAERRAQMILSHEDDELQSCREYLARWRDVLDGVGDDEFIELIVRQSLDLDLYLARAASLFGIDEIQFERIQSLANFDQVFAASEDEVDPTGIHATEDEIATFWHRAIGLHDQLRMIEVGFTDAKARFTPGDDHYDVIVRALSEGLAAAADRVMAAYSQEILERLSAESNAPEVTWVFPTATGTRANWQEFERLAPTVRQKRMN